MEDKTTKILEIQIDESNAIDAMVQLKDAIVATKDAENALTKELKDNEKTQRLSAEQVQQKKKELEALKQAEADYKAQLNEVSRAVQNEIKQDRLKEGSLKGLRAELSNLTKAYDELSRTEREGAKGQELLAHINKVTTEIKGSEEASQRYYRNVGNYKNALLEVGNGFKAAGISTNGFNGALKLLNANPIILILSAIAMAVKAVVDSFKENEEATMALEQAYAALNPIIDAGKRIMEVFAKVITTVVGTAVDNLRRSIQGLLSAGQAVANFFGADVHWGDNYREATEAAQNLTKAEQEYVKKKREYEVEAAKIDRDVADLREKAADKENYTAQQRLEYLDKAIELETKKAEQDKELAQMHLNNLKQEAARSANSAEMNDKLAAAEAAVYQADKNLSDTKRTLNKQRQQAINDINGMTGATVKNTAAVKDNIAELEKQAQAYRDLTLAEMQKAEDALNNIITDAFEKRRAIEDTAYQRQQDKLKEAMENEKKAHGDQTALYQAYQDQLLALRTSHAMKMQQIDNDEQARQDAMQKKEIDDRAAADKLYWENKINEAIVAGEEYGRIELEMLQSNIDNLEQYATESDAQFYARRLAAQKAYNEKKKALAQAELQIETAKANGIASLAGSISQTMEAVAGENKELVKASKIVALAEVAIKQGVAIAEAVASAAAGDPYTYAIRVAVAIASTVAAMAQAIASIKSAKFARGTGYVNGAGTATSDSIPAMLSRGEGVANAAGNAAFPGLVDAINAVGNGMAVPVQNSTSYTYNSVANAAGGITAEQLAEALALMPAPQVAVTEINEVNGRVTEVLENARTL